MPPLLSVDPFTCPDPLAERRYAYAQAAAADGDWRAAAEVLAQALERAPGWAPAWFALGEALEKLGDDKAAAAAYRETLEADCKDRLGAEPRLARLEGRAIAALPPAYVAQLFDDYAPRFERHLRESLDYRGPELILEALDAVAPNRRFALALDLGCGSGLSGRAMRSRVDRLVGVDLSPAMIAQARAAGVYDQLAVGDLGEFLGARAPGGADLIVAADTLVYLGDLRPVVAAVATALGRGGSFGFTVEAGEAAFALGESLRFRHSDAHLREAAAEAGLTIARLAPVATRREGARDVAGRIVVLGK